MIDIASVNIETLIEELLDRDGSVKVKFADNTIIDMEVRKLIFHLVFWEVGRRWQIPILPHHVVDTSKVNSTTISNLTTSIYLDIKRLHTNCDMVTMDINNAMNKLNNLVIEHCQTHHASIDIVGLAKTAYLPEISRICSDKVTEQTTVTMRDDEIKLKSNSKALYKELTRYHLDNAIYPFISLRFVKPTQLAHIFYQIGYRSDVNDTIVRYPVSGNYLDGLRNYKEYALEAISAKKTAFYNQSSIPKSEYFGRRQHILASSISKLYPGDCGSKVLVPIMITDKIIKRSSVLYKNAVINGKLTTITKDDLGSLFGKTIDFRSPMTCKYTDGVCSVCAGELLSNVAKRIHIGIYSAIQVTSPITQFILSAKHMQETSAIEYALPDDLNTIMIKKKNGIFIKDKLADKLKELVLVLPQNVGMHLTNIPDMVISSIKSVSESAFGKVNGIAFMRNGLPVTDQVEMIVNYQQPVFSKHLIMYIHNHPEVITVDDGLVYITLNKFDISKSVFRLITFNNSMARFVDNAEKMLERDIAKYTSIPELITDIGDMMYDHINTNLAYIEVVLKAALVTNKFDSRIPVVENIDDVHFNTNKNINLTRSLGNLFAFQELPKALLSPLAYVIPKICGKFDDFLNLKHR